MACARNSSFCASCPSWTAPPLPRCRSALVPQAPDLVPPALLLHARRKAVMATSSPVAFFFTIGRGRQPLPSLLSGTTLDPQPSSLPSPLRWTCSTSVTKALLSSLTIARPSTCTTLTRLKLLDDRGLAFRSTRAGATLFIHVTRRQEARPFITMGASTASPRSWVKYQRPEARSAAACPKKGREIRACGFPPRLSACFTFFPFAREKIKKVVTRGV